MFYVGLAISVGLAIYQAVSRPKPKDIEGPRLGDLSIQSSSRGAPLPRVWASYRVVGNVIDGRKFEVKTEEEVGGGKGFGGGGAIQTTYAYFADFAVTLCEGTIGGVRRIWLNNKLWYDTSDTASDAAQTASGEHAQYFKVYPGTATQNSDPTLEAIHGAGNVPPYRHTAYIVFTGLPLDVFGNTIPQVSCEVVQGAPVAPPAVTNFGSVAAVATAVDPLTGYLWTSGGDGTVRVWNTSGTPALVATIPITLAGGSSGGIVLHPGTRMFWLIRENTVDADVVRISADSYAQIDTVEIDNNLFYSPFFISYHSTNDHMYISGNGGSHGGKTWGVNASSPPPATTPELLLDLNTPAIGWSAAAPPHSLLACCTLSASPRRILITALPYGITTTTINWPDSSGNGAGGRVFYDSVRDCFWWTWDSGRICKIALPSLTLTTLVTLPHTVMDTAFGNGKLYVINGDTVDIIYTVDLDTGAYTSVENNFYGSSAYAQSPLLAFGGYLVKDGRWKIPFGGGLSQQGVLLSSIVTDLCLEAGLTAPDISVTALTDTVPGYIRAQPTEASSAIEPLQACYLFDGVESDYILKFPKRGGASVKTLTEAVLGAHAYGESRPDPITLTRTQEVELPNAVSVRYTAQKYDYQQGTQIKKRRIGRSQHATALDLPIVLTNTSARRLAQILMDNAWTERTRYSFALAVDSIALDPADVVTVNLDDGSSHLIRLTKVDFGAPGLLRVEAVAEDAANYTSDATAQDDSIAIEPLSPIPATRLELLDTPIFRDQDNDAGFHYAMAGYVGGWEGAVLYKSIDGGGTYAVLDAMATAAAIGNATTALATGPTTIWDNGNTVTVRLTQGTLSSDTEANVLAGKNAAVLGLHGRWEVIQYQTATLNADGSYTLSKLLRGRKGTEHSTANHTIADKFIALTLTTVDRALAATSEIGLQRHYKAVSAGSSLQATAAQAFTNTGVGLECYSPVNIKGTRVSSGDITITWIRRTRADGEWRDAVDVPLFETSEKYDVEVFNGAKTIVEYTLKARNDGFLSDTPTAWRLQYSDAGVWYTAHTVSGEPNWSLGEIRTYTATAAAPSGTWRILIDNVQGGSGHTNVAIAEMQMRVSAGGVDQCTGGTATASGDIGASFAAAKAFDDDAATMWNSGTPIGAWLQYAFAGGGAVVRTFTDVTTQSQVYSSANQVTDFGSNQAAVTIKVYQKSAIVARGYPGFATV